MTIIIIVTINNYVNVTCYLYSLICQNIIHKWYIDLFLRATEKILIHFRSKIPWVTIAFHQMINVRLKFNTMEHFHSLSIIIIISIEFFIELNLFSLNISIFFFDLYIFAKIFFNCDENFLFGICTAVMSKHHRSGFCKCFFVIS